MGCGSHHENSQSDASATGDGSLPEKEEGPLWVVVCGLDGRLVADLRMTVPPTLRGSRKDLRASVTRVLDTLNDKTLMRLPASSRQDKAGSAGAIETQEPKPEPENMKTNLLNEEQGDGSTNGGGQGQTPGTLEPATPPAETATEEPTTSTPAPTLPDEGQPAAAE